MAAYKKLDIHDVLNQITQKNSKWLQEQTEDKIKAFAPVVVQRFLCGADLSQESHIYTTNLHCNQYIFTLHEHPILLYKLFCVANGFQEPTRYRYVKPNPPTKKPKSTKVVMEYFNIPQHQAIDCMPLLSVEDVELYAANLGMDKKEVKAIVAEW